MLGGLPWLKRWLGLVCLAGGCATHGPLLLPADSDAAGAGGEAGASDSGNPGGQAAAPTTECGPIAPPHAWGDWPMPNPASSGLPHPASYSVSASGEQTTDGVTGLIWQRQASSGVMTWEDAKRYCACLGVDGTGGWRLPSRIELASLVDYTKTTPSIDSDAFPDTSPENFWTASEVGIGTGLVYLVFFDNGHTTYATPDYEYRARCVRGEPTQPAVRYDVANGVVHDVSSELSWQRQIPSERVGWVEATDYCKALALDPEHGPWRLPSINELQTLVLESQNPSIDTAAFPNTPSEYFWSSSTVTDDATRAWTTFFTNGSTYSFAATSLKNVRCVR